MTDYTDETRALWNAWTRSHTTSDHYRDAERYLQTGCSLRGIELAELAPAIAGQRLLHLQCNLGSDTLSWARLGAEATGVDLADAAIAYARALAEETATRATFLAANVYALPSAFDAAFDVVYTSYGAVCWLRDMQEWARGIARCTRPGGTFYMIEAHPAAETLAQVSPGGNDASAEPLFRLAYPYSGSDTPQSSPAEHTGGQPLAVHIWQHSLGEIVSALISAGFAIEYLHEHPVTFWQQFSALTAGTDGYWHWPAAISFPLLFSLRAVRRQ